MTLGPNEALGNAPFQGGDSMVAGGEDPSPVPGVLPSEEEEEAWFAGGRQSSVPPSWNAIPPSVESVGEFLGDPVADAWLR